MPSTYPRGVDRAASAESDPRHAVPGSLPWRHDAQPVPVRIFEVALATGTSFLVDGHPELRGDGVNIAHVQMDEATPRRVTCMFGQVEADIASRDGNEPRETGLELMLPFLPEPQALVPLNRSCGVRHTENWHNPSFTLRP